MNITRMIALNMKSIDMRRVDFPTLTTMNYYVTPDVIITFDKIMAGSQPLSPAGFFMDDANDIEEAERKIFARQSKERVELIFKNETVSACMSDEEQSMLMDLFEKNNFVSQLVTITLDGQEVNAFNMFPEESNLLAPILNELHIESVIDLGEQDFTLDTVREEMKKAAYERFKNESLNDIGIGKKNKKENKVEPKEVIKKGLISTTLGITGGFMEMISNRMMKKSTLKGVMVALPLKGLSKVLTVVATAHAASLANDLLGGEYV